MCNESRAKLGRRRMKRAWRRLPGKIKSPSCSNKLLREERRVRLQGAKGLPAVLLRERDVFDKADSRNEVTGPFLAGVPGVGGRSGLR